MTQKPLTEGLTKGLTKPAGVTSARPTGGPPPPQPNQAPKSPSTPGQ